MKINLKFALLISIATLTFSACATHHLNTNFQFQNKNLILTPPKNNSIIYILINNSQRQIILNHPADHPGTASAGWGSIVDSNKSSAILMNSNPFAITCTEISKSSSKLVNCKFILGVQAIADFTSKAPAIRNSSYWIAENLKPKNLSTAVAKRGFKITTTLDNPSSKF